MIVQLQSIAGDLETVLLDFQASLTLWKAAETMALDERDEESADTLRCIFGERIEGEIERLEEAFNGLHDLLVESGKNGVLTADRERPKALLARGGARAVCCAT